MNELQINIIFQTLEEICKSLRRIECQLADKPCSCERKKVKDEPVSAPLNDR